jgi:hypothetical protein
MRKKKNTRKNGKGKLTKRQERELAALDAMPEPVTEMAREMRELHRKLILSGEHHRSGHIFREILEGR